MIAAVLNKKKGRERGSGMRERQFKGGYRVWPRGAAEWPQSRGGGVGQGAAPRLVAGLPAGFPVALSGRQREKTGPAGSSSASGAFNQPRKGSRGAAAAARRCFRGRGGTSTAAAPRPAWQSCARTCRQTSGHTRRTGSRTRQTCAGRRAGAGAEAGRARGSRGGQGQRQAGRAGAGRARGKQGWSGAEAGR